MQRSSSQFGSVKSVEIFAISTMRPVLKRLMRQSVIAWRSASKNFMPVQKAFQKMLSEVVHEIEKSEHHRTAKRAADQINHAAHSRGNKGKKNATRTRHSNMRSAVH